MYSVEIGQASLILDTGGRRIALDGERGNIASTSDHCATHRCARAKWRAYCIADDDGGTTGRRRVG